MRRHRAGQMGAFMNQRETFEPATASRQDWRALLSTVGPVVAGIGSVLVANVFQQTLFSDLHNYPLTILLFVWLFGMMMCCAFGVVAMPKRSPSASESLTGRSCSPSRSSSSRWHCSQPSCCTAKTIRRSHATQCSTLMIVLNGMVGTALLMGALRYWEQEYNLAGARVFLVVIASLAVFALIIPNYTKTEPDPSQAPMKAVLFASITVLFYIVFVIIQTARHRAFFAEPSHSHSHESDALHGGSRGSSLAFHVALLLLTLIPTVLLSKSRAIGIENLGFPAPLGGVMIAILVL